jgi:hypothetical protein
VLVEFLLLTLRSVNILLHCLVVWSYEMGKKERERERERVRRWGRKNERERESE